MASPSSTLYHILNGLQHPHLVQSTLMQLKDLGVTENILKSTGARDKVSRFARDSFFGPLARSILNEWDEQIKEFSPSSSPSASSNDVGYQMNQLLHQLSDPLQTEVALKSLGEIEMTADLLFKTEARKRIEHAIFARKLVCTSLGRRASRLLAQWSEQFPHFAAVHRSEPSKESNGRKRRSSDESSSSYDEIKKFRPGPLNENYEEMFKSRKSHTKLYAGRSKESTMVLRPSTNIKTSQLSKLSEAAKLEEIKKKIAFKISDSKQGKRKILQVSVSGLSARNSHAFSHGRRFN